MPGDSDGGSDHDCAGHEPDGSESDDEPDGSESNDEQDGSESDDRGDYSVDGFGEPETAESPESPKKPPWLEKLHELVKEYLEAQTIDGNDLKFVYSALESPYFPWENLTEMLVAVWALTCRPSRKSLQMLLDLLRVEDSQGCRFNPRDVPRSAEHLISRMRQRLPLLPVVRREVEGKRGVPAQIVECPFNLMYQRMLDCPRIVEELLNNPGGKQMSEMERTRSRVPDEHCTPIATREPDGARKSFMHGDIMMASAHMGLECVTTADGVRIVIGDTVMADVSAFGSTPHPCRLAGYYWQNARSRARGNIQLARGGGFFPQFQPLERVDEGEESDSSSSSSSDSSSSDASSSDSSSSASSSDSSSSASSSVTEDEQEGGHLVLVLNPFVFKKDMPRNVKGKRRRDDSFESLWEITNQPEEVRVDALVGPCMVFPVDNDGAAAGEVADDMPTFAGEGFVATARRTRRLHVVKSPWRRSGVHGWYHDRRSSDAYTNEDNLPVVSTGFVCSSDGFNYLSGNRKYGVRGTYLAPACASSALLRRLRVWWLGVLGVQSRWEDELGPLTSIFQMLENGCRARMRTSDNETETVRKYLLLCTFHGILSVCVGLVENYVFFAWRQILGLVEVHRLSNNVPFSASRKSSSLASAQHMISEIFRRDLYLRDSCVDTNPTSCRTKFPVLLYFVPATTFRSIFSIYQCRSS